MKQGLETALLPWQAELMRWIWGTGGEVDSRTAHNRLRNSTTPVSRASAINFLDRMVGEGFLERREVTSKGGHKRLYRPSRVAPDEGGFRRTLADRIFDRVRTELLGDAAEEPTRTRKNQTKEPSRPTPKETGPPRRWVSGPLVAAGKP